LARIFAGLVFLTTNILPMGIFDKRVAFKPYEYPEVLKFREAIKHSRWDVEEFNFGSDAYEFKHELTDKEKEVIKRTLLAISQIEISVKTFWMKLGDHLPKPEFNAIGATFGENEVVHSEAYSKLLEVLGFNNEFDLLLQNPVIGGRVDYLSKYLKNSGENAKQVYTLNLALFSMFIENVSLFSQFAIVKSFTEKKNLLKEIDTVIEATMKEEIIHAQLGMYLINQIKKEHPEWFDQEFYDKIYRACYKAYEAEVRILEWIFEQGDIDSISLDCVKEFIKNRFNESIQTIGGKVFFSVNEEKLRPLYWMVEAIYGYVRNDFFATQGTNYTKYQKSITANDLF
jgi:ribonucleoside-diphosphate reductase beta chain